METTNFHITNLKEEFGDPHHVEIVSVSYAEDRHMVLLNIWITNEYRSIEQVVAFVNNTHVVARYRLDENSDLRWQCVYTLNHRSYYLGSAYSSLYKGAKLALLDRGLLKKAQLFDKGYGTTINRIEASFNKTLLISGDWYKCERAGGHDDYWPVSWCLVVGEDTFEPIVNALTRPLPPKGTFVAQREDYYCLEDYGVSKYVDIEGRRLLWNQGLGSIGKEELMPIQQIAPFYTKHKDKPLKADGVWFAGTDYTHEDRPYARPFLGRVTSKGTILSFAPELEDYPAIRKIHALVAGADSDCLLIGETLEIGKGTGFFFLYLNFSGISWVKNIQYLNFQHSHLLTFMGDLPMFDDCYFETKEIHIQGEHLAELAQIQIFGNLSHGRNRDNGILYSIDIKKLFQGLQIPYQENK